MHAYFFNARGRNINNFFSGWPFHLALKMPVLVEFAVAFRKICFWFSCLFMPRVVSVLDGPVPSKNKCFPNTPDPRIWRPLRPAEKGLSDLKTAGPTSGYHYWVREFMFGISSCHMCPSFAGEHVARDLTWLVQPLDPTDTKRYTPDVLE